MATDGKRQSEYPTNAAPDGLDKVLLCENPDPAGNGSVAARVTQQAGVPSFSGTTTLITAAQSPYTLQRNNEIVLVDTTAADVTITVPAGWPDDSKFTVTSVMPSLFAVIIQASGGELLEPSHIPSSTYRSSTFVLRQSDSVSYIKSGTNWYVYSKSMDKYFEGYYVPALDTAPITIGTKAIIPISLDENIWSRSLLFGNAIGGGGLLTSNDTMAVTADVQVILNHDMQANNSDIEVTIYPEDSTASPSSIIAPIGSSFFHSRTGTFFDSRYMASVIFLTAGSTIGIYSEQLEMQGNASTDITGFYVTFTI